VRNCVGAIFTRERASLRPYALVTSLLRILVKQHLLQLYTRTEVTLVTSPTEGEPYYIIQTSKGRVRARHVVNATNAWIGHLYPEFQGIITPVRGQVIQVSAGGHSHIQPIVWNYGADYMAQRPDGTLIFGGGRRFSTSSTTPPQHLKLTLETREIGVTDDTSIDPQVSSFLHSFLPAQLHLTSMRGNPPPIPSLSEWTGIMAYTADLHPFVGEVAPRKWVIGGFYGHGMVRIWLSAKALVQQLLATDQNHEEMPWPSWFPKGFIHRPERLRASTPSQP